MVTIYDSSTESMGFTAYEELKMNCEFIGCKGSDYKIMNFLK